MITPLRVLKYRQGYTPMEFPGYDEPWHFPGILWKVPWWPVRIYLSEADRVLFHLWFFTVEWQWRVAERLEQIAARREAGR